jgi:hypothetical protein
MCIQFCAIPPHEGRNVIFSLSTKVEYATDITLGRIVRSKSLGVQWNNSRYIKYKESQTIFGVVAALLLQTIVFDRYIVINVRDAYEIFCAIEYLLQNIPN